MLDHITVDAKPLKDYFKEETGKQAREVFQEHVGFTSLIKKRAVIKEKFPQKGACHGKVKQYTFEEVRMENQKRMAKNFDTKIDVKMQSSKKNRLEALLKFICYRVEQFGNFNTKRDISSKPDVFYSDMNDVLTEAQKKDGSYHKVTIWIDLKDLEKLGKIYHEGKRTLTFFLGQKRKESVDKQTENTNPSPGQNSESGTEVVTACQQPNRPPIEVVIETEEEPSGLKRRRISILISEEVLRG